MLKQWLLITKTIFIISCFQFVYTWNPSCSPCRCFEQNNKNRYKVSDCSSSVTSLPLTKIPELNIEAESVFLVGQQLQIIPEDAIFSGRKNGLKFLDLKNCEVRSVHVNAFRNLENLSGLDLSHNELSQLFEQVFDYNNKLKTLILQKNNFKVFPEKIFHNLPSLKYLDLSENKLHYIYPNQFKTNLNLERLIIQSNYLTRFDHTIISNLPKLNVLYLDNNPWKCNCKTKDLQKLIIDRKIEFVFNDNYPSCTKPNQWKGKKWLEVKPKDLCSVPDTPTKSATEGDNFVVECTLESNNPQTVEWFFNGQPLDTSNSQKYLFSESRTDPNRYLHYYELQINNVQINDIGVYKCWSSDAKGTDIQYEETILDVEQGIKPGVYGPEKQKKLVQNGEMDYKLPCEIIGSPTPTIEWLFNGRVINFSEFNWCQREQSSENTLLFSQIDSACFGNYTCRATNSKGTAEQNYELLALPQSPPTIYAVSNIDNNNAFEGTSISLNCFVSESVLVEVEWLKNNEVILPNNKYSIKVEHISEGMYNYILTVSDISFSEAGNYKCRANTVESPEFTVNVNPSAKPTITDFENQNEIILEPGDSKDIPCIANGIPPPTITWERPQPDCNKDSFVQDETLYLRNVNCPGRYKCIVENSKGKTEKEFTLSIATPKISNTSITTDYSDNEISEHDDITLTCLVEGSITSQPFWEFNSRAIKSNNKYKIKTIPQGKNKYYYNLEIKSVTVLDKGNYKCRLGADYKSVDVNVKPATLPRIVYITDTETYIETNTKDFKLECRVSGTHPNIGWIYPHDNYCTYDETIEDRGDYKVAILSIKQIYLTCQGQYTCAVNNKQGDEEKVVNLYVVSPQPPEPEIESNYVDNKAIENEEVILKCLIRGAITTQPRWLFNGEYTADKYQIVKQEISKTSYWYNLIIKNLKQEDTGNYKCVIGNYERTVTLNVTPSVKPTIEYISNSQTIELGQKNVRIACRVSGSPKPKITWSKPIGCNHELIQEVTDSTETIYLVIPEVTNSCSGRYTCIATSSKGQETRDVDISVDSIDEPPQVDLETLFDNQVIENEDVTLKCFVKTHIFEPDWIHDGLVIKTNNKYRIVKVPVNKTAYWYNLIISKVSTEDKGSYKCRINNFEQEILVNVTKSKKPEIEYISNSNTVEEGKKDFTLSCKVDGVPKPKVFWEFEGQQITKTSSNKFTCKYSLTSEITNSVEWLYLTIKTTEPSCAGKYKCITENSQGREENEINLSIVGVQPPEIIEPPKTVFENSNVTLQCLIKGSIDSKPSWLHNNRKIVINNNKHKLIVLPIDETSYWYNLEITNISPFDRGNYKCKINNYETQILLQTQPGQKPQILRISRPNIDIEEGTKQITLPCQVTGNPVPETIWLYENIPIDITSNNCQYKLTNETIGNQQEVKLIIQNVGPSCAGKYKCLSKNLKGSNEREVNVKVIPIPPPIVEFTPQNGNQILENEEVTLKCLVPNMRYSAEWYKKDEPVIYVPNGRYSIDFEPVNATAYWYNLVISKLVVNDSGEYKCKINNLESILNIVVESSIKPTIEYIPPKENIVSEGTKDFRLACKASGTPIPKVSWQFESPTSKNNCKHTITSEVTGNSEWTYLTIAEVTQSCSGTYKCVSKNSVGIHEQEINLSVNSGKQTHQISVRSTSPDGVIREDDDVTLTCLTTGNQKAKWYHNKTPIESKYDNRFHLDTQKVNAMTIWNILTIKNASLQDRGEYFCKINSEEQSYYLEIERGLIPSIEYLSSSKIIVDQGTEETILSCKVTDSTDYVAEWTLNGKQLDESGCTDTSVSYEKTRHFEWYNLTITNITSLCAGQFKCIVRNFHNNDNNAINVSVLPFKPPIINVSSKSTDGYILEQDSVTLKCLITSSNTNGAKWIYRGKVISSDSTHKITKLIINETTYWYNLELPNVSIHQSGVYICSTNKAVVEHNLNVNPGFKPIIDQISNSDTIVEEGTKELTLFCKAKGSPLPTISWAHQSKSIKPGQCRLQSYIENNVNSRINYITITNIKPSCSGAIICTASNSKGTTKEVINLTVIPIEKPEITVNSTSPDGIIREGDDVILTCLATGKSNNSARWFFKAKYGDNENGNFNFNNNEINPLTYRYNLIIKNISFDQAGVYSCRRGSVENNVNIDVQHSTPAMIEQFPKSGLVVLQAGSKESTLYCKVSGLPEPEVIWLHNKKPLDFSRDAKCKYQIHSSNQWFNLTISDATLYCNGLYQCVATSFKNVDKKSLRVTVINPEPPQIKTSTDLTINSSDRDTFLENAEVTLRCLVKGDFNTDTVNWLFKGQIIKEPHHSPNHKILREKLDDISFWYNLQIKRISPLYAGNYQCKTATSQTDINVKVQSTTRPTITLTTPNKMFVQSGAKLTIPCISTGTPIPSVTWQFNNKTSECENSCQYKTSNITNLKTANTHGIYLNLTDITLGCAGQYKCVAENAAGKVQKSVELVVVPPNQPEVHVQEPIHINLATDVTIPCKVISVDQPSVTWKYHDKKVDFDRYKYIINHSHGDNLHYSNLTILNFQESNFGDYTCEASLNDLQNFKTISLKAKTKFKPEFIKLDKIWENFERIGDDLVLITKVKGYPPPTLQWEYEGSEIKPDNLKYFSDVSYISDDQYWFNQTIKNYVFNGYSEVHLFTVKNEIGEATKEFIVNIYHETGSSSGRFDITVGRDSNYVVPAT